MSGATKLSAKNYPPHFVEPVIAIKEDNYCYTIAKPLIRMFTDITEMLDYLEQLPTDYDKSMGRLLDGRVPSSLDDDWEDWFKTKNYAEGMQLARDGWPDGLKQIKKSVATLNEKIGDKLKLPAPVYDVVGETPDVGVFLTGEPEHMMRFEDSESQRRIIRIVVNTGASWSVSADEIMRKGAVACALVEAVENMGWRSEIVACLAETGHGGSHLEYRCPIKNPDEPLNMDRVVFALAHPSYLRRLMFRAMELESNAVRRAIGVFGGYGRPGESALDPERDEYGVAKSGEEIYLDSLHWDRYREDCSAEKYALKILERIGAKLTLEEVQ